MESRFFYLSAALTAALAGCSAAQRQSATCGAPEVHPEPICGPNRCGNGAIDSCVSCTPGPVCPLCSSPREPVSDPSCTSGSGYVRAELCDGADLGGTSCTSLGFSGGALACNAFCSYDTNDCASCQPGPKILACRHTALAANLPRALAIATGDDRILVAWVPGPGLHGAPPVAGGVQLALFDGNLSLLRQSGCLALPHAYDVAIARTRTGHVLAVEADGQVVIQPLDASGTPRGRSRALAGAIRPVLVSRADGETVSGGPLLVWAAPPPGTPNPPAVEVRAALLDDDGATQAGPMTVFAAANPLHRTSGVFTGAGFVVAATYSTGLIAHVSPDGTVTVPATPALVPGAYAGLAWSGTAGGVVYSALDQAATPGAWWAPMDATGNGTAPPVALGSRVYLPPPALAMAGGVEILPSSDPQEMVDVTRGVQVARLSQAGAVVAAPFPVVSDPEGLTAPRLAALHGDAILAWVGAVDGYPGRIGLARIAP